MILATFLIRFRTDHKFQDWDFPSLAGTLLNLWRCLHPTPVNIHQISIKIIILFLLPAAGPQLPRKLSIKVAIKRLERISKHVAFEDCNLKTEKPRRKTADCRLVTEERSEVTEYWGLETRRLRQFSGRKSREKRGAEAEGGIKAGFNFGFNLQTLPTLTVQLVKIGAY